MGYTHFISRALSLAVIVGAFAGYNHVITYKDSQAAELIANDEQAAVDAGVLEIKEEYNYINTKEVVRYADGTYTDSAKGYGGDVEVQVTIADGAISNIELTSAANEDKAYLDMAVSVIDEMIGSGSTDVDTVSGATFSSTGIINATKKAIAQAEYTETVEEGSNE